VVTDAADSQALLRLREVSVHFGGIVAVDRVSIDVAERQVTGLIGPNGAGKTTLLGVASGLVTPAAGRIMLDGHDVTKLRPHQRARLGMSRTFQRLELWDSMTVEGNVRTAAEFAARWKPEIRPAEVSAELIERLRLGRIARTQTRLLPSGLARVVEVARALASLPRVVLLDEPSAGLDDRESRELAEIVSLVAEGGAAILLVEHHVEMVLSASAHVAVLDFGQLIAEGPPAAIRNDERVQAAYLGRPA
jgi:branched-chain amino acid transport system ATP-binding protein